MARPDILDQVPQVRKDLWTRIVRDPSDVLIISEALLPTPLKTRMAELQTQADSPETIVLSESTDPVVHAQLLAQGCDAVLYAGLAIEQVRDVINAMLEKRRRQTQKHFFTPQPMAEPRLADFVSQSPAMAEFMNVVPRVVRSDTSLLIEGETGVGKERLACAIHSEGLRTTGRFVALNCGALPEHLLESELFGHVRGAFTGATAARRGWFEIAHRGTLFLDEVSEIPLHLQVKLLRVLQEHEVQPVGGEKSFGVDVRIIAASNRPLGAEVAANRFRRDLFHRLSVVTVTVPPLRHRIEDIPTLVQRHIHFLSLLMHRHVTGIRPEALEALCKYPWPGNIRELNNVLERAILLCDDTEITLADLADSVAHVPVPSGALAELLLVSPSGRHLRPEHQVGETATQTLTATPVDAGYRVRLPEQWLEKPHHELRDQFLSDLERQYIEGLLMVTRGRINAAAKRAGLPERSLYEKMQQFGLHKETYRKAHGGEAATPVPD